MDYRKNMNTPRDMVDEEMLLRLMREAEPSAAVFCGNARRENRRRNNTGTCGCTSPVRQEETRDVRYGNRCGCGSENSPRETVEQRICGREYAGERENENENRPCESCIHDEHMKHFRLAMAYVPWQEWEKIYEEEAALARGTLFEALDLPWYPSACDRGNGNCGKCGDNR